MNKFILIVFLLFVAKLAYSATLVLEDGKLYDVGKTDKREVFSKEGEITSFLVVDDDVVFSTIVRPFDGPTEIKLHLGDIGTGLVKKTQSLTNYSANGKQVEIWQTAAPNRITLFSKTYSIVAYTNTKSKTIFDGAVAIVNNENLNVEGIVKGQYISLIRGGDGLPKMVCVNSLLSHKGPGIDGFAYGPPVVYLWTMQLQRQERLISQFPSETSPSIVFPVQILDPTDETLALARPNTRLMTPPAWNAVGDKFCFVSYDPKNSSVNLNIVELNPQHGLPFKVDSISEKIPSNIINEIVLMDKNEGFAALMHRSPIVLKWSGNVVSAFVNGAPIFDIH